MLIKHFCVSACARKIVSCADGNHGNNLFIASLLPYSLVFESQLEIGMYFAIAIKTVHSTLARFGFASILQIIDQT